MSDAGDEFDWGKVREWRRVQDLMTEQSYSEIIQRVIEQTETAISFYTRVKLDDYATVTLGEWGGYFIQTMPMGFTDRLVMTPMSCTGGYDYGWCYPKGGAAVLAALAWNPQSKSEPVGYIKRFGVKRLAGERAAGSDQPNG